MTGIWMAVGATLATLTGATSGWPWAVGVIAASLFGSGLAHLLERQQRRQADRAAREQLRWMGYEHFSGPSDRVGEP